MDFRASIFGGVRYQRFGVSEDGSGGGCCCGPQCCQDLRSGPCGTIVVSDRADVDQKWQSFLANEGWIISQEIYANLESTLNLFDTADGTHAKLASDGHVGVLLVFDMDEIHMLLATYFDGMDGNEGAQSAFGSWVSGVMGLLDACIGDASPEG